MGDDESSNDNASEDAEWRRRREKEEEEERASRYRMNKYNNTPEEEAETQRLIATLDSTM